MNIKNNNLRKIRREKDLTQVPLKEILLQEMRKQIIINLIKLLKQQILRVLQRKTLRLKTKIGASGNGISGGQKQ